MSQQEIMDTLKEHKKPISAKEISQKLNKTTIKVNLTLRKLIDHNEVDYIELDPETSMIKHNSKRRVRLYFIPVFILFVSIF